MNPLLLLFVQILNQVPFDPRYVVLHWPRLHHYCYCHYHSLTKWYDSLSCIVTY